MNLSELYQLCVNPPGGWKNAAHDTQYAIITVGSKRWLIFCSTCSLEDLLTDARALPMKVQTPKGQKGQAIIHEGMAKCVPDLPIEAFQGIDAVAGYSLGAGLAQIYGLLAKVPAYCFGSPAIVYSAPKGSMDGSIHILTRGDPIGKIPMVRWGAATVRLGFPRFFARGKYYLWPYYVECLKRSPFGWLELAGA